MNEQRFRVLETRALYEIGLPTAFFWGALGLQLVLNLVGLRVRFGAFGLNLFVYNTILAVGFTGVWLLALLWTQTHVIISDKGLRLEVLHVPQWEVMWGQLMAWTWDWHWTGVPIGVVLIPKSATTPLKLRLGFIGLGRRVGKIVVPYLPYVPLLKALGYYLQGEQWIEPPPKPMGKAGFKQW
jgi:hypothetical protein